MRRTAAALAVALSVAAILAGSAGWRPRSPPSCSWSSRRSPPRVTGPYSPTEVEGTFNVANKTGSGEGEFALFAGSEVNCQIHDPGGQTPPGTSEGVKANARGVNFNKHLEGDNVFVMIS